nr:cAMP-dependent protein kinase catalytic subunit beta isoform X5 [Rattus norvegicus]
MWEQAEPWHCAPRLALPHRIPPRGRIWGASKLTVSMSLATSRLASEVKLSIHSGEQLFTTSALHRGVPVQPGGGGALAYVTSGAPARKEAEVALWVCVYWGRAVSGTRLEGGLGKGECLRAAATATVPVSARELAASLLDTQPLCAPGRCAPGSVGVKQKQELLQTAGRRDGPGPLPSVTPAYGLPGHGEHGDRQERQRSGERSRFLFSRGLLFRATSRLDVIRPAPLPGLLCRTQTGGDHISIT